MEPANERRLIDAPRPRRRRQRRQRPPLPPPTLPPSPLAAALSKNLVLLTRCPRGSLGDRLGPSSVFAWRALFPALLAALVVASLTTSTGGGPPPLPPSPPRKAAALDLDSPLWADEYRGPARRFNHRARVAFAPSDSRAAEALVPRLAAALACLERRDPETRSFGSLFRAVPDWPPLPLECGSGGQACERNEACWDWLIRYEDEGEGAEEEEEEEEEGGGGLSGRGRRRRRKNRRNPAAALAATPWDAALIGFPSHDAARRASLQRPDTLDALVLLDEEWEEGGEKGGLSSSSSSPSLPSYVLAANASLLPPDLRSPPGRISSASSSLGPPTPHRSLWFVTNLAAAVEQALTGLAIFGPSWPFSPPPSTSSSSAASDSLRATPPPRLSWRFKPFPWPGSASAPDVAGAAVSGGLRLLFAWGALPPARRAASALAGERLGGGRDALRAAGLSALAHWGSHAAAHAVEASAAALALMFGLWSWGGLPFVAAAVAALLSAAAGCAVVASAYFFAAVVAGGSSSGGGGFFSKRRKRNSSASFSSSTAVAAAPASGGGGGAAASAAGDYFSLSYILLALPGYLSASLSPISDGIWGKVVWLLAAVSPPSAAMLAGGAAAAAARVAVPFRGGEAGGSIREMLSASCSPGVAGAPSVAAVFAILLADFALWALAAALAEAALDPEAAEEAREEEGEGERTNAAAAAAAALLPPATAVAESVSLTYPGSSTRALDALSFVAPPAPRVTALLGPNGAGKSSAMAVLTGRARPDSGRASVAGGRPGLPGAARVCAQADSGLWPLLTVREHLELYRAIRGGGGEEEEEEAEEEEGEEGEEEGSDDDNDEVSLLASSLGLSRKLDARVSELSGGQRRATSLATALVGGGGGGGKRDESSSSSPLLLDEPTAGLDATARRAAWRAITSSRRGVLLCTHALEEADAAASRAVVVARGRAVASGTPAELRELAGGGCVLTLSLLASSVSSSAASSSSSSSPLEEIEREVLLAVPSAKRGGGETFAAAETSSSPSPSTVSFRLPDSASAHFPALLRSLDSKRERLGISGIGVSVVPLEEAVAALVAGVAGGGGEREVEEEEVEALPPPILPPPPLPLPPRLRGPRLALSRLSALLGRQLTSARRRWRRESLDALSAVAAVAFAAWLAGSGGFSGNSSASFAHPPAPLSRAVALGGMPAALGASLAARGTSDKSGGDSRGTLLPSFASALGPPPAEDTGATCLWPEAESRGGRTLDDLLLERWYEGGGRKEGVRFFDAAFVERWSDSSAKSAFGRFPSTVTLLANGSAPAALPAALSAASAAARAMMLNSSKATLSSSCSSPPAAAAGIEALDPGPTAAATKVGSLVGAWLLALQLSSTVSFAAAAAARRAASERGGGGGGAGGGLLLRLLSRRKTAAPSASSSPSGGIATQLRLAGASPGLLLASRFSADLLRTSLWLCGAVAAIALLGPRALLADSRPSSLGSLSAVVVSEISSSPLLPLAALTLAAAAASLPLGYLLASPPFSPLFPSDPDGVSSAVMQLGTWGTLALILKEAAALAPLLWPAAAAEAARFSSAVESLGSALLPSFNLLRGVLSVALVATGVSDGDDDDNGGRGMGMRRAELLDGIAGTKAVSVAFSTSSSSSSSPPVFSSSPSSFFSWGVAGQPLACLLAQAMAFLVLAWLADGGVASLLAGAGAARRRGSGGGGGEAQAPPPLLPVTTASPSLLSSSSTSVPWPLVVSNVSKSYPVAAARSRSGASSSTLMALRGVSLSAAPGSCTGVVGANGAGKSTLFALIAGECSADCGKVLVCGEVARRARARGAGTLGYCPQAGSGGGIGNGNSSGSASFSPLPPELTALEALVLLSRLRGAPSAALAAREATELLAAVGLGTNSGRSENPAAARAAALQPLFELSGGTARRVAAAAALVGNPRLLVLDEATAGLDSAARALLWRLLRRRLTVSASSSSSSFLLPAALVSSHRLAEVEQACDSVVILVAGRVAASGSPQELREALGGFYSVEVRMPPKGNGDSDAASDSAALSAALGPAAVLLRPQTSASGTKDDEEKEESTSLLRFRVAAAPATPGGLDLASLYERLEGAVSSSSSSGGVIRGAARYSVSQASLEDVFVDVIEREAERERRGR